MVAAHGHVVPAEVIIVVDEKKDLMNKLIKIGMKEKDDSIVRVLQKAVLKDEKMKELCATPRAVALQKRVLEVQDETAKRHRAAAIEDWEILISVADTDKVKAQIDLQRAEANIKLQELRITKH